MPVGVRIVLLAAACVVGGLLNVVAPGRPDFAVLTLVAAGLLFLAFMLRRPRRAVVGGIFVALDLAWVLIALHFTGGLASPLAPLLYAVVVLACLRLSAVDIGLALSGAAVGLVTLAYVWSEGGLNLALAASNIALLGAVTITARWYLGWLESERRAASEKARTYEQLIDATGDTVVTADRSWRVLDVRQDARRLLGIDGPDGASGQLRLFDLLRPTQPRPVEFMIAAVAEGKSALNVPMETCGEDGLRRSLEVTAVPFDASLRGSGISVVLRDVTEARRRQQALAQPGTQATVDEVVGTITHELNNPLAAIRLTAELATLATQIPELGDIIAQVDRCTKVIGSLRAYTTTRDGHEEPLSSPRAESRNM